MNRGRLVGKPVEELKANPLPDGALENVYKNRSLTNHFRNFFEGVVAGKEPISDVFSHHRALTTCHLAGIAARLGRKIKWDPRTEKIVGDEQAQNLVSRKRREGFDIKTRTQPARHRDPPPTNGRFDSSLSHPVGHVMYIF